MRLFYDVVVCLFAFAIYISLSIVIVVVILVLYCFHRYLKRIFKELFERQGFEDDGLFDWDILKKQREV